MSEQPAPIIVKKKKVIAGGHHGGAWKVAYADFVTAMMAFFLLMWLLGATTENQRKGIADYFNPTIPINRVSGGGSGAFGGDSIFSENTLSQSGTGTGTENSARTAEVQEDGAAGADQEADQQTAAEANGSDPMEEVIEQFMAKTGESVLRDLLNRHVMTRLTDEGLVVEVFAVEDTPLFDASGEPTRVLENVLGAIADVFVSVENEIAVQGHTATVPLAARENPVWELSAAWADRARRILIDEGIPPRQMQRVTGFADRKPVLVDPLAARNNRLEIVLLRDDV